MIAMTNQIRSVLYLLSRDAYLKGAVVLPVLALAVLIGVPALVGAASGALYPAAGWASLARGVVTVGAVFGTTFTMMGLAAHDTAAGGLRVACLAERGRGRSVAARMLAAGLVALGLAAWSALLALACLPLPGVTAAEPVDLAAFAADALVRALVGWAYAAVAMLLVTSRGAYGFFGVTAVSFLLVNGFLEMVVLLVPAVVCVVCGFGSAFDLLVLVSQYLPRGVLATGLAPGGPGGVARSLLAPLVVVALCWAIERRLMARRAL